MKQLFTLIACFFFFTGFSSIVYKPINYTLNIDGNLSYNLDVNSDGTIDYVLSFSLDNQSQNLLCKIIGQAVGGNTNVSDENPEMTGDPVGSNASWSTNLVLFSSNGSGYDGGEFTSGEHYVGLSFTLNNNNYRAWLRITVSHYNTCVINDLAFDNVSGNDITVGAGLPTAIDVIAPNTVNITSLSNNLVVIAPNTDLTDSRIIVTDLAGREAFSGGVESSNQTIPFSTKAASIYIASLYLNNGQVITRKVTVQ